jgi:septal ring factor EnvC (AmiA/AmiB activator)
MHRYLVGFVTLCLTVSFVFADELDDKMLQLRQIEKQIDIIQQKARQAEQKKQKAQKDISSTMKTKTQVDQKVVTLQKKEEIVQDSLDAISQRVQSNEEKIEEMKKLGNNEFLRLFYIDMQDKYIVKETKDKYLLSLLISLTVKGITDLTGYHKVLVQSQEERRSEYLNVKYTRVKEVKKSQQYQKKITTLTQQATKLEKEKLSYEQQVSKLKKDASELETLISRLTAQTGKKVNNYQFSGKTIPWPVRGTILREFGEESRGNNTSVINNGIDISVPEGTSVKAVDDGEVVFSDRYGGQGKLIIIDHKNGFFSVYAYNRDLLAAKGSAVKKGQVIAKSGRTGSATQPSLHFELRKDGRAVNPMNYLE